MIEEIKYTQLDININTNLKDGNNKRINVPYKFNMLINLLEQYENKLKEGEEKIEKKGGGIP